jgi:hypothetical protein
MTDKKGDGDAVATQAAKAEPAAEMVVHMSQQLQNFSMEDNRLKCEPVPYLRITTHPEYFFLKVKIAAASKRKRLHQVWRLP